MKELHNITLTTTVVVYASTEDVAQRIALRSVANTELDFDATSASTIKSWDDIPLGWHPESQPMGHFEDGEEKTIVDILENT